MAVKNDMPTFSLRIPSWMAEHMKERTDLNWSEILRNTIQEHLGGVPLPSDVEGLINIYKNENSWDKLRYLAFKVQLFHDREVENNLNALFPGKAKEISRSIEADFARHGITLDPMKWYEPDGTRLHLLKALESKGIFDRFEKDVEESLKSASREMKEAAWLLSQYFLSYYDAYGFIVGTSAICPEGFIRTAGYLGLPDMKNELMSKCLILVLNTQSTRAYAPHEHWEMPEYAQLLYETLVDDEEKRKKILSFIKGDEFKSFRQWMSKQMNKRPDFNFNGIDLCLPEYEEEKIMSTFEGEKIDTVLKDLIANGVLIIRYLQSRSRVGRRAPRPASWLYQYTPIARRLLL